MLGLGNVELLLDDGLFIVGGVGLFDTLESDKAGGIGQVSDMTGFPLARDSQRVLSTAVSDSAKQVASRGGVLGYVLGAVVGELQVWAADYADLHFAIDDEGKTNGCLLYTSRCV